MKDLYAKVAQELDDRGIHAEVMDEGVMMKTAEVGYFTWALMLVLSTDHDQDGLFLESFDAIPVIQGGRFGYSVCSYPTCD